MRWLDIVRHRLRSLLHPTDVDRDLDDEMSFVVGEQMAERLAAGASPADARRDVLHAIGGLEQIKEACRDMDRVRWVESIAADLRFGARTFCRRPGLTATMLAVMMFGVGSTTAIFSIVNGVLLTPLPYQQPERLVRVFGVWEHGSREGVSPPDFFDYRAQMTVFESVAAAGNSTRLLNLTATGDPEQVPSRSITAGFFATLGVQLLLGREFQRDEEAWKGPPVAILTYGLWQRQFGGDRTVVGHAISVNGVSHTVVGVLPTFFNFLGNAELFTPLQSNPVPAMRGIRTLSMIGRLKDGVTLARAQSELTVLARRLQQEHREYDRDWSTTLASLTSEVVKDVRPGLLLLLVAVGFVVLLMASNVAGLMLSHAVNRRVEIGVRLSLGASRSRIARQLMTETLLLALTGGVLGSALGVVAVEIIKRFGPPTIPRLAAVAIDERALAVAFVTSVAAGLVCGLEPACRAGRQNLSDAISAWRTPSHQSVFRDLLVVTQVAISMALLIGAGLLARSLAQLERVDPGFDRTHVLTTRMALSTATLSDGTGAKLAAFWQDLLTRLELIPGVERAAMISELPLSGINNPSPRVATTSGGRSFVVDLRSVSPHYASVMGIPLREGRFTTDEDRQRMPRVVVINERFRREAFAGRNPIGERLRFNFQERSEPDNYQATIVGVIGDVHHASLASAPVREAYVPVAQSPLANYDLVLRTSGDPLSLASRVRREVTAIDREQSVGLLRSLDDVVDTGLAQPRFRSYVLGLFAFVALLLAASGLFGLLSFMVTERHKEIAIRMAIGASEDDVLRLILAKGATLTCAGAVVGLAIAIGLSRLLSTFVFGIAPSDVLTFAAGIALLAIVALGACYIPALRAVRVDPMCALKAD